MDIRIGGGRLATINLDGQTRLNCDGLAYPTHCSLTFWNGDEEITIFATREQIKAFGKKIVKNCEEAELAAGLNATPHNPTLGEEDE